MHNFRIGFFNVKQKRARCGRSGTDFPRRAACLLLLAVIDVALRAHCHAEDKGLWFPTVEGPATPSALVDTPATAATAETVATAIPCGAKIDATCGVTTLIGGAAPDGVDDELPASVTLNIIGDEGLISIVGLPLLTSPG